MAVLFASARESILAIFDHVLNTDNGYGQYRSPPFDTAFIKVHGLLFTGRDSEKFETSKGYHIAISKNIRYWTLRWKVISLEPSLNTHIEGTTATDESLAATSSKYAQYLSKASLDIILHRLGDPNVLPFIHITLVIQKKAKLNGKLSGFPT